jgi:hypothetical protein
MATFTLPKNSTIGQGQVFKAEPGAKDVRAFKIYRWDPDTGDNPRTDTYELDLAQTGMPPQLMSLQRLSRPRQANLLRHWLHSQFAAAPSAAQLAELLDQIADCTTRGHHIRIKVAAGYVERRGGGLHWYNPALSA